METGFGEFIGFSSAWGYWMSALICVEGAVVLVAVRSGTVPRNDYSLWRGHTDLCQRAKRKRAVADAAALLYSYQIAGIPGDCMTGIHPIFLMM